ncbi:hypothetical protein NXS08_04265 [Gleimia sp. 6138-11-ORH1]|uniref:hypothetical protein n=1 Tax=Gleimia sp. 6138-11-ORH1 TaxID=2973937 RepID=UPI0021695FDC|nr:hypothetical protein [Gleimia sp. 6138-11-ORH1]MCS4484696.1 hypothetical protein [Gleimia sp. 6138-11-ORH1]
MFKLSARLIFHDIFRLTGVTIILTALTACLVLSFALLAKAPILGGILAGTLAFLTLAIAGGFTYAFTLRHSSYLGYLHLNGVKLTRLTLMATTLPLLFAWIGVGLGTLGGYLLLSSPYLNTYSVFVKATAPAFNYASYQVTPLIATLVSQLLLTLVSFGILSIAVSPTQIRRQAVI